MLNLSASIVGSTLLYGFSAGTCFCTLVFADDSYES